MMWNKSIIFVFTVIVGFCLGRIVFADNHYVSLDGLHSSPYTNWDNAATNIQDAIDAATAADIVWISNGVYAVTNTVTITNAINVLGYTNNGEVVIDGSDARRCFDVNTNEYCNLANLLFTKGLADNGGGVRMGAGSATNCVFSNNVCSGNGGGIYILSAKSKTNVIQSCLFISNSAAVHGGGLCVFTPGNPAARQYIIDSTFHTNSAGNSGGGAYTFNNDYGRIYVSNCVFTCNRAVTAGGFLANKMMPLWRWTPTWPEMGGVWSCSVVSNTAGTIGGVSAYISYLTNCIITDNIANGTAVYSGGINVTASFVCNCYIARNQCVCVTATYGGGGAYFFSAGIMENCIIDGNISARRGGGVLMDGGTILNCLLINNQALYGGGMMKATGRPEIPIITGCTIVSNYASTDCGGGVHTTNAYIMIDNSIIYFNKSGGSGTYSNYLIPNNWATFTNCCISPELPVGFTNVNVITTDPQLVDWQGGNYRLSLGSPCFNTGSNQLWMTNTYAKDLDGKQRIIYGIVDIGAFECSDRYLIMFGDSLLNTRGSGLSNTRGYIVPLDIPYK